MSNLAMIHQDQHLSANTAGLPDRVLRLCNPVIVLANGYRALHGNSATDLFGALLAEVDETIFPRRIKVLTDTNQTAYLHVVNRRLFRISMPGGQVDASFTSPTSAKGMVTQLLALLADATKAVVHSERTNDAGSQAEAGYTVAALSDATSMDFVCSTKPDSVQAFCDDLADLAIASVELDRAGHLVKRDGDPAWCRRLETLVHAGLAEIDDQMIQSLTAPGQPGCIFLSTGGDDGFILVYARSQSAGFLATLPACHLPVIQPAWLALFG